MPVPSLRTLLFRLHWALGLVLGLVLAIMGATGGLMAYEEAIVAFANRGVGAVGSEEPRLAPPALVARVEAQSPGRIVSGLTIETDAPVIVRFGRRAGADERPAPVNVDPWTGEILGPVRLAEGFATVRALHRWLLLPGDGRGWGRTVTGIAAIALLVFVASGLYLRWPALHGWRVWLRPRLARPGRARWWSLHAVAGTWLAPVYVVSVLTGLTWSFPAWKDATTWLLTGEARMERPAARARMERPDRDGGERPRRPALEQAWTAFADGEGRDAGTTILTLPGPDRGAIRIRWQPRGADPHGGYDEAAYDATTGALRTIARTADKPLGRRMAESMLEVHRGRFFGSLPALVFALAALALPGFAATGLVLWVLRRRSRARSGAREVRRGTGAPAAVPRPEPGSATGLPIR